MNLFQGLFKLGSGHICIYLLLFKVCYYAVGGAVFNTQLKFILCKIRAVLTGDNFKAVLGKKPVFKLGGITCGKLYRGNCGAEIQQAVAQAQVKKLALPQLLFCDCFVLGSLFHNAKPFFVDLINYSIPYFAEKSRFFLADRID